MATIKRGVGQLLVDLQVLSITAGGIVYSINAVDNVLASGEVRMTPNSVGYTQPTTSTVWDAIYLEVFPGVLNAGQTEPDLWLWPQVDNEDFSDSFYADCSISGNVFPSPENTVNRSFTAIGKSLMRGIITGHLMREGNAAVNYTGWKVTKDLTFYFTSTAGFTTGVGGTFSDPPRIKLYGDVWDSAAISQLSAMMGSWPGQINLNSLRRQIDPSLGPYSAIHTLPSGGFGFNTFGALPGGPRQGSVKCFRYLKVSQPLINTTGTVIFPLTNTVSQVGGKGGNVALKADLGFDFSASNSALRVTEWGRRPGAGAGYSGFTHGSGSAYPYETSYGLVCTQGEPIIPFGQVQPYRTAAQLYYGISQQCAWGNWCPAEKGPEVIAGETIAFHIAAQQNATITGGTTPTIDKTLVGGTIVVA